MTNFDVVNNSWNAIDPQYFSNNNLFSGFYFDIDAQFALVSENGRAGLGTILVQGVANNNVDAQYSGLNVSRHTITVAAIQEDGSPGNSPPTWVPTMAPACSSRHRGRVSIPPTSPAPTAAIRAAITASPREPHSRRRSSPASSR